MNGAPAREGSLLRQVGPRPKGVRQSLLRRNAGQARGGATPAVMLTPTGTGTHQRGALLERERPQPSSSSATRSDAHIEATTFATVKSIVPVPPPTSTRICAWSILPSVMPAASHALKCSLTEICPHWRAVWRTL